MIYNIDNGWNQLLDVFRAQNECLNVVFNVIGVSYVYSIVFGEATNPSNLEI